MGDTLVVGGTGGIGSAVVRRFAAEGHSVDFTYLRATSSAEALAGEVRAAGGRAQGWQLDVRDDKALDQVVGECGDELTTIVFCAASGVNNDLVEAKPRHWDWTFEINVKALGTVWRSAMARLGRNRGCLLTMTSLGARQVLPAYGIVGATKAAMEAFVRYAAVEGGPSGIRVNAVCPGVVDTKALEAFPEHGRRLREAASRTPLGRLTTPEEVAGITSWLASEDARMINGHVLVVDGGWELVGPVS